MSKVSTNISLDPELKRASQELYADLGLDLTTAITVFLKKSLAVQGFPFAVTRGTGGSEAPEHVLREILAEYGEMKQHPERYKKYASFQDALDEVLTDEA